MIITGSDSWGFGKKGFDDCKIENCEFNKVMFVDCSFSDVLIQNVSLTDIKVQKVNLNDRHIDGNEAFLEAVGLKK